MLSLIILGGLSSHINPCEQSNDVMMGTASGMKVSRQMEKALEDKTEGIPLN